MAKLPTELLREIADYAHINVREQLRCGLYHLCVDRIVTERIGTHRVVLLDFDVRVHTATGDEAPNSVGSKCRLEVDFDGPAAKAAAYIVTEFILGLFNKKPGEASTETINKTFIELASVANPAQGMLIGCEVGWCTSRKGRLYRKHKWFGLSDNYPTAAVPPPPPSLPPEAPLPVQAPLVPGTPEFAAAVEVEKQKLRSIDTVPSHNAPPPPPADTIVRIPVPDVCESPIERALLVVFIAAAQSEGSWGVSFQNGKLIVRGSDWELQPQHELAEHRVRLDFALFRGDKKVAIEADGHEYHATKEAMSKDKRRDRILQNDGWFVRRYTGSEIHRDAIGCVIDALAFVRK